MSQRLFSETMSNEERQDVAVIKLYVRLCGYDHLANDSQTGHQPISGEGSLCAPPHT